MYTYGRPSLEPLVRNIRMWQFHLCLLLVASTLPSLQAEEERHLLVRDSIRAKRKTCKNTMQGFKYLADEDGRVCHRDDLDFETGCCKSGDKHSCQMCNLQDGCCAEFEHCVSCCLAPSHNAVEKSKKAPRIRNHPETGNWDNPFDYCQAICRTHARSTVHENAYIDRRHHCFSELGRPQLSDPLPKGALDNVIVVLGNRGESCSAACNRDRKDCSAAHLKVLNSCDRLREHAGCEAGCEVGEDAGHQPSYVDGGAAKSARPAMCLVSAAPSTSCETQEGNARRLCPCVASGSAAAAATGAAHLRS